MATTTTINLPTLPTLELDDPHYHYFKVFDYESSDEYIPTNEEETEWTPIPSILNDKSFVIKIFGISASGQRASIIVRDFKPFLYISVDESWGSQQVAQFVEFLKNKIEYTKYKCRNCEFTHCASCQVEAIQATLLDRKDLYEFRDGAKNAF